MTIDDFPILSVITFLPLLGALVIAVIPRRYVGAARGAALGFALAAWVVSLWLLVGYLPGPNERHSVIAEADRLDGDRSLTETASRLGVDEIQRPHFRVMLGKLNSFNGGGCHMLYRKRESRFFSK